MKKILFTEGQLKYILGEAETFIYLDKGDQGCDASIESNVDTGTEVSTNDLDADEFPTTDAVADMKTRSHPFYRNSGYGTMFEDEDKKKDLNERNHQLDGRTYRLGKKVNQEIDAIAANNSGDKMVNNMSKNKDASANCLYVRQNRLNQMKKEDPVRYQNIDGKRLQKTIGDTLNRATAETKTQTPNIQDPMLTTVQTARSGTGKGHRKDNSRTIYYENN